MKHWKWTNENVELFKKVVKESFSYHDVIRKMGFSTNSGASNRRVHLGINKFQISTEHFLGQCWSKGKTIISDGRVSRKSIDEIFCENSMSSRSYVRDLIQKENLIPYTCQKCGIVDEWNGNPISLELDHVNGKNRDHRLCNLRFLCPNCHSQTETFCRNTLNRYTDTDIVDASIGCTSIHGVMTKLGATTGTNYRRFKKILPWLAQKTSRHVERELSTPAEFNAKNKSSEWKANIGKSNRRVEWPSKSELEVLVDSKPLTKIGEQFLVSDNSIRKWCKHYGIEMKPIGYWTKRFYNK